MKFFKYRNLQEIDATRKKRAAQGCGEDQTKFYFPSPWKFDDSRLPIIVESNTEIDDGEVQIRTIYDGYFDKYAEWENQFNHSYVLFFSQREEGIETIFETLTFSEEHKDFTDEESLEIAKKTFDLLNWKPCFHLILTDPEEVL